MVSGASVTLNSIRRSIQKKISPGSRELYVSCEVMIIIMRNVQQVIRDFIPSLIGVATYGTTRSAAPYVLNIRYLDL